MKRFWLSSAFTVLFCLAWSPNSSGQTPPGHKVKLVSSTNLPVTYGSGTIGWWSGAGLLVVEDRFSGAPVFRSFDANNTQLSQFVLTIPEAALIKVFGFARGFDGSIAGEGTAVTNDSRGTPFLALISPDGQKQTIVRTPPFWPDAITVASDGAIWVAGHEHMEPGWPPNHEQVLLHRYDKTGKLLGSFVTWSSVPTGPHVGPPSRRSTLVASKDRIGWHAPLAHVYIELSLDGAVLSRFDTGPIDGGRKALYSAALCDGGGAFLGAPIFTGSQRTGWQIFALDRQGNRWNPIATNGKGGELLLGCEGTKLASTDGLTISWLDEPGN